MCDSPKICEDGLLTELIDGNCPPLLFKGAVDDWSAMKWTPQSLAEVVGNKALRCKIIERDEREVCPETECLHVNCSLQQYCDWLVGCCKGTSPLKSLDPVQYACYIDYKYMKDMFEDCQQLLEEVQWANFGFPERNGADSTIWIGSTGAYTPCHQDTYGFNLVTQIHGCKRWFLFDPGQTSYMYPTRVPYEESSVFSEVNILQPDLTAHKLFKETTPFVVDLHPGDTLYVPRHWWHFVQCVTSSISVNTWIPVKEDLQSNVQESITRFLMSTLVHALPGINLDTVLNPTEELTSTETSLKYVEMAIDRLKNSSICNSEDQHLHSVDDKHYITRDRSQEPSAQTSTEKSNITKLKNAFKGYSVTQMAKHCCISKVSDIRSLSETSEEPYSPQKKKTKLHTHSSSELHYKKKEMLNSYKTEVFSLPKCSFNEYMSMLNCHTSLTNDIEADEMFEQIACSTQGCSSSGVACSSDHVLKKSPSNVKDFQHTILNAILNTNVTDKITKNIMRN